MFVRARQNMSRTYKTVIPAFFSFILISCQSDNSKKVSTPLFTSIPPQSIGIDFENTIEYTEAFNVYTYRNFYNGGGVGIGDINNDGLPDLFFCGNMVDNRLYLNKGDFQFEDITELAGVASSGVWSTGVSIIDADGDGWLDIYVCKSGSPEGENRHNELFINNGDLTFTEKAVEFGLADKGLSTHAAFFDYDKDGDLDCYLLNNSFRSVGGYDLRPGQREIRDPEGGNKLYRNDNSHFTDVSEIAGIYGSNIGFGLGVTIGDINRDGYQDIYVSNDFFEKDYLYMNNGDGTFTEALEDQINEISLGSMGADIADINNDGFPEIFVTEMLPETEGRLKTKAMFDNWERYSLTIKNGYYKQFGRNVLQLNNGRVSGLESNEVYFSEIGRLSGVFATDWSWGALIFDMDNDGYKDLFVANGIYKDLLDQDYIHLMAGEETVREILKKEQAVLKRLIDAMPSEPISNYAFHNNGDLTFKNRAQEWGLATPGFSSGSAFGDLDNDGDLDLIINNVNMPPFIFRNESNSITENHYLTLQLIGEGGNSGALGTQVTIVSDSMILYQELANMRGFQSTVDSRLLFGLGTISHIDSVIVEWPNEKITVLKNVRADQKLVLRQSLALDRAITKSPVICDTPLKDISAELNIPFKHIENDFVDFEREKLIFHMLSNEGPSITIGDLDGDGLQDFHIGGAREMPGAIFLQTPDARFIENHQIAFDTDKISEDTDGLFFDADGDGDLDLYVTSGGNEFSTSSMALLDRLYFNDGHGNFTRSDQLLPEARFVSTSCVRGADYDGDGDIDLFVGARLRPYLYGVPVNGYILNNDGAGNFKNVTEDIAPDLIEVGMITAMQWTDYDNDGDLDIIMAGDWMPVKVFVQDQGKFFDGSKAAGLEGTNGIWTSLKIIDLDKDGNMDIIAGNLGLNSRFKASQDKPATMYVNDFDGNGQAEQIICTYNGDETYPLVMKHDLVSQLPELRKKYPRYEDYKEQRIDDIFSPEVLARSVKLTVYTTATSVFINNGNGVFDIRPLPTEAQFTPVYAIQTIDLNDDNIMDILLGGNLYRAKPEMGIYDAGYGLALAGTENLNFKVITPHQSGFFVKGEIRDIEILRGPDHRLILVARNNDSLKVFRYDSLFNSN